VNTALDNVLAENALKGVARDEWNRAAREDWGRYAPAIEQSLAVYDGLDANCGNQLLARAAAGPGRYAALAGVLADDRLFVDTTAGACNTYFAVELGIANDCGGRTLFYDVIDVTYSALAVGSLTGVTDGGRADEETHSHEFPFLAAP
jgi:hypothetical protein